MMHPELTGAVSSADISRRMDRPKQLVEPGTTGWTTVARNIQHTPSGGYRVRQRVGAKRITLGVFATLAEALAYQVAAVEIAVKHAAKGRPTLATWMPTYFERRQASGVRSVANERNRAAKHVNSSKLARIPMGTLHRSDILAWLRELDAKLVDLEGQRVGWSRKRAAQNRAIEPAKTLATRRAHPNPTKTLSRQTRVHCLKLVRGALAAALDEGLISENPAVGIKLRKETRVDDGSTVLTPTEQVRLLNVIPEPERWIVAAAIGGGWRMGEHWSLELADVHLDAEIPYVDIRYGAAGRKPTKAGKPRRIPLVGPGLSALRAWMAIRTEWCGSSSDLVFPTVRGAHRGKKPPRKWKEWLSLAGITRRFRWHDLRHTCASALVSGQWGRKWTLEEVKAYLGHSSIRTTERYARFAGDALMQAARETNEFSAARTETT